MECQVLFTYNAVSNTLQCVKYIMAFTCDLHAPLLANCETLTSTWSFDAPLNYKSPLNGTGMGRFTANPFI